MNEIVALLTESIRYGDPSVQMTVPIS